MILDDPPPPPSSQSTLSLSSFPPRPPPTSDRSDSSYRYQNSEADHREPLLPYAFSHGQPNQTSFGQYPSAPGPVDAGVGSLAQVLSSGRGRFRLLVLAASACLLFLLHAHFYRPRLRHRPPPHFWPLPPGFGPPLPPPPPVEAIDVPPAAPVFPHNAPHRNGAPPQAPPPPPPTTTFLLPEPTITAVPELSTAELPFLPLELLVQPRRKTPPTSPNPWPALDESWGGHAWLSPERFTADGGGAKDPPLLSPPPARWLEKAFRWAARDKADASRAVLLGLATAAKRTKWDRQTGRPLMVPREGVFMGKEEEWERPSIRVAEVEQGRGARKLERVQWDGKAMKKGMKDERERREWVKRAFLHVWEGYKENAWGHDELKPLTNTSNDNYNGWGATIIDTLDTLLIMNLSHEYNLAREHVAMVDFTYLVPKAEFSTKLPPIEDLELFEDEDQEEPVEPGDDDEGDERAAEPEPHRRVPFFSFGSEHQSPSTVPFFETTIRYLGGLLSAYDLSGDPLMLARATELGDWLLPGLGTKHGLALGRYTIGANPAGAQSGRCILSEAGSLAMEFTRLSMLTGDETYFHAVQRSMDTLDKGFTSSKLAKDPRSPRARLGTLLPAYIDPQFPDATAGEFTFGGLADSYYEYLIKQYQVLGGASDQYSRMYTEAIDSAYQHLIRPVEVVPGRDDLITIGVKAWGRFTPVLEHLTCFAGGMLGLGSRLLSRPRDMDTALGVTEACAWAYESTATGIAPETLAFYEPQDPSRYYVVDAPDGVSKARKPRGVPMGVKNSNPKYIGRPETIESVFYMYRLTGDRKWQDRGWQMFTSWVEHAINEVGFTTITDVNHINNKRADSMESFVLAETLKYYYLLFSPTTLISLDNYVFNTEAHPFRIPKPSPQPAPEYLWTGPDESSLLSPSFASNIGQGTPVQLWARVQQAAALNRAKARSREHLAGLAGAGKGIPDRRPTFVKPSEEQLDQARDQLRKDHAAEETTPKDGQPELNEERN